MSLLNRLRPVVPALLVLLAGGLQAQTGNMPPPPAAFFQPAEMNETALSPSGRYLAVTTSKLGGRRALFVFDLSPGGKPSQAARFDDVDVVNVAWVGDDRLLFQGVDLGLGSGSLNQRPGGLYAVGRDGGNQRELVRRSRMTGDGGRLGDRTLPPDHSLLARIAGDDGRPSEEVLVGSPRINTAGDAATIVPLRVNVNTGKVSTIEDLKAPSNTNTWLFDSRGNARVAVAYEKTDVTTWWRGPGEADWRVISRDKLFEESFKPVFVDDSGTLYVTRREGAEGIEVLSRFDFKTGKPEPTAVLKAPGFDLAPAFIRSSKGGTLGVRINTDAEQTIWFDAAMKAFQAKADDLLPGRVNRINCVRCGAADMVALVRSQSDREPGQVLVYRAQGDSWQSVGRAMPGIDPAQMARMDFQRIQARDGRDLPVWLTLPKGVKPGQPAPAVVFVHGGPNVRGSYWGWNPYTQFLASRGYLVIEPEFRGSDGFGRAHLEAGFRQWGQAMQDDVADALLWARKQGLANDKACIAGASYGGYATLAGLMRHPELYRCGIAFVAVTDLMLLAKGSSLVDTDVGALARSYTLTRRLGDPEKDAAMLLAHSPVEQAAKIKAPVLLGFGEADLRVPLAHGLRMREALRKAGNEPEWVVYAEEGHQWQLPKTNIDFAERMEKFLGKHLGKP